MGRQTEINEHAGKRIDRCAARPVRNEESRQQNSRTGLDRACKNREIRHTRAENGTWQRNMGGQKWTWRERSEHDEGRTPKTRRKQNNIEHVWNEKNHGMSRGGQNRQVVKSSRTRQDKTGHDTTQHTRRQMCRVRQRGTGQRVTTKVRTE